MSTLSLSAMYVRNNIQILSFVYSILIWYRSKTNKDKFFLFIHIHFELYLSECSLLSISCSPFFFLYHLYILYRKYMNFIYRKHRKQRENT